MRKRGEKERREREGGREGERDRKKETERKGKRRRERDIERETENKKYKKAFLLQVTGNCYYKLFFLY